MCRGRRRAHHRFDVGVGQGIEDAIEHEQIGVFVLEQEFEVIGERIARPVALVKDSPGTIGAAAAAHVLVGDAVRPSHGRGNRQLMYERRAVQTSALGDCLFLERGRLGEL